MNDILLWLALGYLGVAIILYVVLSETVIDAHSDDEDSHLQVVVLWPLIFVVGVFNLLLNRKPPPSP
jgi:hypothetical protein